MTDEAIVEHIIYLVNEHTKQVNVSRYLYMKEHMLACRAIAREPNNRSIVFPLEPKSLSETATDLLDRITAT